MKKEKIKYPATMLVHWPSGPVACCGKHGQQLIGLGGILGSHIVATKLEKPRECSNCKNEAEDNGHKKQ